MPRYGYQALPHSDPSTLEPPVVAITQTTHAEYIVLTHRLFRDRLGFDFPFSPIVLPPSSTLFSRKLSASIPRQPTRQPACTYGPPLHHYPSDGVRLMMTQVYPFAELHQTSQPPFTWRISTSLITPLFLLVPSLVLLDLLRDFSFSLGHRTLSSIRSWTRRFFFTHLLVLFASRLFDPLLALRPSQPASSSCAVSVEGGEGRMAISISLRMKGSPSLPSALV